MLRLTVFVVLPAWSGFLVLMTALLSGCGASPAQGSPASEEQIVQVEEWPMRTWTDSTGRHHTEAAFVDFAAGKIRLKKKDGTIVFVPVEKLSELDREYVIREIHRGVPRKNRGASKPDAQRGRREALTTDYPNWPQFRGPGGLGISDQKALPVTWGPDQNLVWKRELPGAGSSSPIVIGNRAFLTCYSGYGAPGAPSGDVARLKRHLVCLNRADGKILWNKVLPAKLPELPYEGHMQQHGYAPSTPVGDGDRVYAFFGKSGVFAFDHNGRQLWQADVGSGTHPWCGPSPILYKDLVIVNAGVESGSLVALDRRTGREMWRTGGIRYSYNTPLLVELPGGKTELVVQIGGGGEAGRGKLLGFDPDTGQQLWGCAGDPGYICASAVAHDGVIYAVPRGTVMAVRAGGRDDVTESHRLWTGRKGSNVPSPVVDDGHLYWANESGGIVYCADTKTGRIVYEQRLQGVGEIYASPVLADGKLYYLTRKGRTFVLAAGPKFEQLAANDLDDGSIFNASPAVAGNRLLLRSDRFLYCIGNSNQ